MNGLIDLLVPASAGAWFPLLVESAIKATAVIALAALLVLVFHRASAARRHLIWAFGLAALALLPAMLAALPAWKVASSAVTWVAPLETPGAPAAPATPAAERTENAPVEAPGIAPPAEPAKDPVASPEVSRATHATDPALSDTPVAPVARPVDWRGVLVMVWLVGALAVLATFATGHVVLRMLLREARRIRSGEWHELANEAADQLRLSVPFALLQGRGVPVPVAFGLLRPRVLLPPEADTWPLQRRRSVLLHELAHVQRHDCITQAVAQLACALFWFHPAVWWAEARLRVERERACDDRVLASETRASDYADHLLDVVRSLRATRLAALGAVAFAKKSSLEGRLIAVLDPGRDRRTVTARVAIPATLLAALVVLPLAALEPAARVQAGTTLNGSIYTKRSSPIDPAALQPSTVMKRRAGDASLGNHLDWARQEAAKVRANEWWVGWRIETSHRKRGGLLSDTEGIDLGLLGRAGLLTLEDVLLDRDRGSYQPDRDSENGQRPTALLVHLANGVPDRVRVQTLELPVDLGQEALFWFEDVTADQTYDWLVDRADRTREIRLRTKLVETVGFLANSDRVRPFLLGVLQSDDAAEVRRAATQGLGWHGAPFTLSVLKEHARSDRSPEVRRQAVESIGNLETPEALDALIELAREGESDENVRRTAFDVIGQQMMEPKTEEERRAKELALAQKRENKSRKPEKEKEKEKFYERESGRPDEKSMPMDRGEFEVQRQAIESMGRYPEAQSLPRLRRIAESSPNGDLRGQAVESIAKLGTPAALAVVDEVIWKSRMETPRIRGIEMLQRVLPEEEALDKLEHIAKEHPDRSTRRMAIEVIGRYGCERARTILAGTVRGGGDPDVQRQAVESLARRDEPNLDRELYEIARTHSSETVRRQAVESIGRRGGPNAAERLLGIAKEDGPEDMRRQAVESLGRLDRDDVKEMLLHLTRSDSRQVARQAVESLGRIEEDTMPELAEIARSHPSGDVRRQAVETMSRRDPERALPLLEEILKTGRRKTAGL